MRRVRMMTLHIDPALQWGLALSILAILTAWLSFGGLMPPGQAVFASTMNAGGSMEPSQSLVSWSDVLRLGIPTVRMTESTASGFTLRTLQSLFYAVTRIEITDPRSFLAAQIPVLTTAPEPQPVVVWTPPSRSLEPTNPTPPTTSPPDGDIAPLPVEVAKPPEAPKKPSILIYHSHNAESYVGTTGQRYIYNNDKLTVLHIGEVLVKELEKLGVVAIQDKTHHMDDVFNDAYLNSRKTVQAALKNNPDFKMVIDLHNDGIDLNITTTVIDNQPVARILTVLSNTTYLSHPNWRQNEAFAKALHKKIEEIYPGLSRGILYQDLARYNQDLHPQALLLEIGGHLNSMDEALRGIPYLAKALAEMIK